MITLVLVAVLVVVVLAAVAVMGYNRLRRTHQGVLEAWAQIDAQLQRRYDLISALNAVVAGAAGQEKVTLPAAVEARSLSPEIERRDGAEREVQAQGRLLVATAERYPQLRSGERFVQLHDQLVRTEDDIAAARRYYNGRVRRHNDTVETFPWSLLARPMRIESVPYFQIDLEDQQVPHVA